MRRTSRILIALTAVFVIAIIYSALARSAAAATPQYAQQTGQTCGVCHERPEGGGSLTATGTAFARSGHQWPVSVTSATQPVSNVDRTIRLIIGYIHLVTAVAWFGTIFYIHVMVRPQTLTSGIPRAEQKLGWISIAIMATTGSVLTYLHYRETGSVFSGTFGTVFLIKLAQFALMVILAAIATRVLDRRMRARARAPAAPAADGILPESLPTFDGREGRKALVAVAGKLYDVTASRLWREGSHARKHQAGQDLTAALQGAPHGPEMLERVPSAGTLQTATATAPAQPHGPSAHRIFVGFAYANLVFAAGILLCVAWWKWGFSWKPAAPAAAPAAQVSAQSAQCIACHTKNGFMSAQIAEWQRSKMAASGTGCYECHRSDPTDVDAMAHNGFSVAAIVSPNHCARCHPTEAQQFASSRHSQAGDILASLDNVLGEKVEGAAAAISGCKQCHGAKVELDANRVPLPASWPNTGIGRINPDGSRGACSTCHTRHLFSVAVARDPNSCGNCHMGPDHPQIEIFDESKHGVAFVANRDKMKLDQRPWVLGVDYSAAPTCASCHMSALPGVPVNHDVGLRISWTLRPAISVKQENWQVRRADMQQVCSQCHSPGFYQNFFSQFDDAVNLYNIKFSGPAQAIMKKLRGAGKLTPLDFDEPIEWTYYLLWHHEGRRARHGAAMMGPDYVQWHGFFEVADRFYNQFIAEAEALLPGVTQPELQDPLHQWRVPKL